jgi:hypothetical protein
LPFFEKDADLRRGAVVVVRQHFHNHRHFVWGISFENDVLHDELFTRELAGTFFDRALNHVTRHGRLARLFHRGRETRIRTDIGPPSFAATIISFTSLPTS